MVVHRLHKGFSTGCAQNFCVILAEKEKIQLKKRPFGQMSANESTNGFGRVSLPSRKNSKEKIPKKKIPEKIPS
jgi:hypothetical protein